MFRLHFTLIPALALALASLALGVDSPRAVRASRPNILLILADDVGFSDLGCYGGEIRTPNLDHLAADGLRFTQFYNGSRCCPSRASLLTGLYAQQTGVGSMTTDEHLPGYRGTLNQQCVTLAEVLRGAGYQTFMSGKWHVGKVLPTERGFEQFYGFYTGYAINSWNPNQMGLFPAGPAHVYAPGKFYATDAITDYALDFIGQARRKPERPWFTYLAYQAGHFPLMAPKAEVDSYAATYEAGWDQIRQARLERLKKLGLLPAGSPLSPRSAIPMPRIARRDGLDAQVNPAWDSLPADRRKDLARRMAIYAAMLEHMDRDIGRILEDLRRHQELDNTLILFLSDNGACAEWAPFGFDLKLDYPAGDGSQGSGHGMDLGTPRVSPVLHTGTDLDGMGQPGGTGLSYGSGWANAGNTPFRMYKHYDHEGGIASPLIVHWPAGLSDKGGIRSQVGHVIDIMPTLVALSGAAYPTQFNGHAILPMEGRSLLPAFANQPVSRGALFWEHDGSRAVREGDLKLVSLPKSPWELYDLSKDRVELHNLADAQPDQAKHLASLWQAWAERCQVLKPTKKAVQPARETAD